VRQRGEWQNSHLPGAYNLPLQEVRLHAGRLDPTVHYVCYCNSGRRAAAAAHILTQIGIAASVLNGHYRHVGGG
jgi:rhodanese-related sulfurtransferase